MDADLALVDRILVPVDFAEADHTENATFSVDGVDVHVSAASLRAIRWAVAIARGAGPACRLRLFHATPALDLNSVYAGPAGSTLPTAAVQEIHERANRFAVAVLERIAQDIREDVSVEFAARPARPVDAILVEARNYQPDLIVMAASGRSRVARFFLGSTADRIIRRAECPVLVIPATNVAKASS